MFTIEQGWRFQQRLTQLWIDNCLHGSQEWLLLSPTHQAHGLSAEQRENIDKAAEKYVKTLQHIFNQHLQNFSLQAEMAERTMEMWIKMLGIKA